MQPKIITITSITLFSIIVLLPILYMFGGIAADGGAAYKVLLLDSKQFSLLKTSLSIALGAAALAVITGVPLGFLIVKTDIPFKRCFKYLYLAPLLIPPYINAIAWINLLGRKGAANLFLMNLFSLQEPLFTIYGTGGVIWVLGLSYFPMITLLTITGLCSMDRKLEEAGRLVKTEFGVIRGITIPLIMPYILSGATFVFIFALSNYGAPSLLRVNVFPMEIFAEFSAYYNESSATALSIPVVLISVILILWQRKQMGDRSYMTLESSSQKTRTIKLGRLRGMMTLYPAAVLFLAVIAPLLILIANAGPLNIYMKALKSAHMQIISSFLLAFAAATLMVTLGFFIAYIIERTNARGRYLLDILTFIPFAVPATVIGIGLIKIWNRPVIDIVYGSSFIIIFGYVSRFIPFVIRAISANLKQINKNLEEAALITGRSWLKRISAVLLPLTAPGILAGWTIAFIFSMGEIGTTLLVIPPGEATLPIRIYTLMHYGANQLVSALCIILIGVTLLPIIIGRLFMRRFSWSLS